MPFTDRIVRPMGATPSLGPAGSLFTDLIYGSRMVRVTDPNYLTDLGITGRSFGSPASGYQQGWNADGTKLFILNGDGTAVVSTFNRTTMATARYGGILGVWGTLTWDPTNPNLLYGYRFAANGHTVGKVDVTTPAFATSTVIDLDTVTGGLNTPNPTYLGALTTGSGNLVCTYGGAGQEYMKYVLWYPLANPAGLKVLDTSTRNGMDGVNSHFTMHSAQVDKSGRFVSIVPSDIAGAPYRTYIYDTTLDTVTPVTSHSGGHECLTFGGRINSDTLTTFDAVQYIFTPSLAAPMNNRVELVSPLASPIEVFAADHTSANNASAISLQPFAASLYRYFDGPNNVPPNLNTVPWRVWDGEILTVATDGTGVIKRFCHHRSLVWPDAGVGSFDFTYVPRVNIDCQGQFAMFTSNWEKTLGGDSVEGNKRRDVFIVELAAVVANPRAFRHRTRLR